MSEELKACPFCGSTNHPYHKEGCFVIAINYTSTIEAWNTRPIEDALRTRIAELELRLDAYNGNLLDVLQAENARLREEAAWVSVGDRLPKTRKVKTEVRCKSKSGRIYYTVAEYVAPRSILAEDYIDDDYSDREWLDYDEEADIYWTPSGWYENQIAETEVNWFLSSNFEITHWRHLPAPPNVTNDAETHDKV